MNHKITKIIFIVLLITMPGALWAQSTISLTNGKPIRIVAPSSDSLQATAKYLQHYLMDRTSNIDQTIYSTIQKVKGACQFVLSTEDNLLRLNIKGPDFQFAKEAHPDSYILEVKPTAGGNTVYLVGKTHNGLKAAVNRFIVKLINDGQHLYMKEEREERSPFINIRLAALAPTARRQIKTGSIHDDANYELWDDHRLRAYPELFSQFGFSGIQVMEIQGYSSISGDYLKKAQNAVKTLMLGAKDLNMFVSLDQWGDCPFVEGRALCWEDPNEQKTLKAFFTDMADRYGKLVDHVYIHVGDPGGATHKGCTKFRTPQLLTEGVLDIFRKKNPKVLGTMSTWANSYFWKHSPVPLNLDNYGDVFQSNNLSFGQPIAENAKFLDSTWMRKDIGIALHRVFNQQQADMLEKAGRPVDVWGWYLGDMEMHNNLTLNTSNIDNYYKALPTNASKQIRSQTIELCFHGWPQIINTYAGAQKMWDPYRDMSEIEKEFCAAAFGSKNADAMLALYRACANPWDYDVWKQPNEHLPRASDVGTQTGNDRLRKVLADSESLIFPKNWKSNFAFPVDVQQYVNMLKARLSLFIAYSETMQKVREARESGQVASIPEIKKKAIESLPSLPIDLLYKKDGTSAKQKFAMLGWEDYINKL